MNIKKKNQLNLTVFILIVLVLCGLMVFYMSKKEGFHEDEMFTYGSSNCTYDNLFQPHGKEDTTNKIVRNYIIVDGNIGKTIENAWYYFTHQDEWNKLFSEISSKEHPVWRTREEAKDYITVAPNERFNYISVYYNQARDVHPPLYCILNHTVCSFFPDTFSKYFFFSISLVFFIGTCFVIRSILKLLDKEKLVIPTVLLYGLSMGAISTVIYARMYMMLAFFTLAYFYLTLKIYKYGFKMTKKTKVLLGTTTILGFLSQYYFCIFALGCFVVMIALMIKEKKWHELKSYILTHVISALIGVLVYPICIYQIFFSYRGVGAAGANGAYFEGLVKFVELLFKAYSLPMILGVVALIIFTAWYIYEFAKSKEKGYLLLLIIPTLLSILVIAKISPYKELRYLYGLLPALSILITLGLSSIVNTTIKNRKIGMAILVVIISIASIYGLATKEPEHLYKGYSNYLKIAEENSEDPFVYIGSGVFNHIQSMPEFMTYKESLILQETQLEYLKDNEELTNSNEFILSIKKYIGNRDKILQQVLDYTGYKNYTVLYDDEGETGCIIFKFSK